MSRVCLLYAHQRYKGWSGKLGLDHVAGPDGSAGSDDGHDSGLADEFSIPSLEYSCQAGIAQTRHIEDDLGANSQPRALGQSEQVDAMCGDVFAKFRRTDAKAFRLQFVEQLGMDQMDLAQVRLSGIDPDARPVFDLTSWCASPSTPSPATILISAVVCFEKRCSLSRATAITLQHPSRQIFPDGHCSPARQSCPEMARSERFELPTLGIEIRCSIQLSYERVRSEYQTWTRRANRSGTPQEAVQKQG